MSWLRKDKTPSVTGGKIDNVLGANTNYEGTIRSDGNIRIDGIFRGRIETAGNLILGPQARVLADVVANVVQVWGSIHGQIRAQGRLEILPNGRVWGDIDVGSLLIDEGGMFRGQCTMAGQGVEEFALPEERRPRIVEGPEAPAGGPEPDEAALAATAEPDEQEQTAETQAATDDEEPGA